MAIKTNIKLKMQVKNCTNNVVTKVVSLHSPFQWLRPSPKFPIVEIHHAVISAD